MIDFKILTGSQEQDGDVITIGLHDGYYGNVHYITFSLKALSKNIDSFPISATRTTNDIFSEHLNAALEGRDTFVTIVSIV